MASVLCAAFFASGVAALLFETLWFRQAGWLVGNTVWASSLVMAGFMAGLAAGNAWAARHGADLRRPVRVYAALEVLVALTGLGLVLLFPALPSLLAPLFRALAENAVLLSTARMAITFSLMLVPAAAMGATLPLLVAALIEPDAPFARTLGRLYGFNTLGAVVGALAGEAFFLPRFGIDGTAAAAAAFNLVAAAAAAVVCGTAERRPRPVVDGEPSPPAAARRWLLVAGFLTGGLLLALEVVWFRIVMMFAYASSVAFASMLAVVLMGIGIGGLLASAWPRLARGAAGATPVLALAAGVATVITYASLGDVLRGYELEGTQITDHVSILLVSIGLMMPTSLLSGALFTLIGDLVKRHVADPTRATGALTLANTCGAALGALGGGMVLLPTLGTERSIFVLALAYGLVAMLVFVGTPPVAAARARWPLLSLAIVYAAVLALFPFGLMRGHLVKRVLARFTRPGARVIPVVHKEGLAETVSYLREERWGTPVSWRLVTNGFSMAANDDLGRRYMRLFVHWPMALRPDAERALLVSFGLGSTAKALTDTPWLRHIDVVDVSRDVLEMGRVMFAPGGYPLDDPRVRIHVEDGRFHLLTTRERYDVITAEPPPPKMAGIVNLYTREYFALVRSRLREGGATTHWLPVYQMEPGESFSVVRAFCDVFDDCSLWSGVELEWMLAGSRGGTARPSEEGFSRQWQDPTLRRALSEIGFEVPEQLGATFIGDAATMREWTRGVAPLVDRDPHRLSYRYVEPSTVRGSYLRLMDPIAARARFEASDFIRARWPEDLRRRTLEYFVPAAIALRAVTPRERWPDDDPLRGLRALDHVLERTPLRTLPLWLMGSGADEQRAADLAVGRGESTPELDEVRGIGAMAAREYRQADVSFARAQPHAAHAPQILRWRILARALAGDAAGARELLRGADFAARRAEPREWDWLVRRLGP